VNEEVQKARRLISSVRLSEVRLIELRAKTAVSVDQITDGMIPWFRHWATVPAGIANGAFKARAFLELAVGEREATEQAVAGKSPVSLRIEYELTYQVPADLVVKRVELNAFAKVNGVFNAWPYFREIVQSTMQRMDLPPVILPVYRVPQAKPQADPPPEAASE
jgi:hypothetical protein